MKGPIVMFIPACGLGTRVAERGHKPFIDLKFLAQHKRALEMVMEQRPSWIPVEIALPSHFGCVPLAEDVTVHFIRRQTAGQADTIREWIARTNNRAPWVLISNCDNCVDKSSILEAICSIHHEKYSSGYVFTFRPLDPKDPRFSYVETDVNRTIIRIKEKNPISDEACAGVYLLRLQELVHALKTTDTYLSEALDRIYGLQAWLVKDYKGWNDMQQLRELESGAPQQRRLDNG